MTVAYKVATSVNAYATYATGFKSVGLNLNGLPTDALGRPVLSAATVKPEDERHIEVGIKTEPFRGVTANVTAYRHRDQGLPGAGRERGRRRAARLSRQRREGARARRRVRRQRPGEPAVCRSTAPTAYTDGKYVSFPDAPPPLEDTGGPQVKDISGSVLPGISEVGALARRRVRATRRRVLGRAGEFFGAVDASYRSSFSSSASASKYLVVDGYSLLNARVGFRWADGWALFAVVAQPARQELLRAAHGGAWQHRAVCGTAGRWPNRRVDPADRVCVEVDATRTLRTHATPCCASPPRRR